MELATSETQIKKSQSSFKVLYIASRACGFLSTITLQNTSDSCKLYNVILSGYRSLDVDPKVGLIREGESVQVHIHRKTHNCPKGFDVEVHYVDCTMGTEPRRDENLEKLWAARKKKEMPTKLSVNFKSFKMTSHFLQKHKEQTAKLMRSLGQDPEAVEKMAEMKALRKTEYCLNSELIEGSSCKLSLSTIKGIYHILNMNPREFCRVTVLDPRTVEDAIFQNGKCLEGTMTELSNGVRKKLSNRHLDGERFIETDFGWYAERITVKQWTVVNPELVDLKDNVYVAQSDFTSLQRYDRVVSVAGKEVRSIIGAMKLIRQMANEKKDYRSPHKKCPTHQKSLRLDSSTSI